MVFRSFSRCFPSFYTKLNISIISKKLSVNKNHGKFGLPNNKLIGEKFRTFNKPTRELYESEALCHESDVIAPKKRYVSRLFDR